MTKNITIHPLPYANDPRNVRGQTTTGVGYKSSDTFTIKTWETLKAGPNFKQVDRTPLIIVEASEAYKLKKYYTGKPGIYCYVCKNASHKAYPGQAFRIQQRTQDHLSSAQKSNKKLQADLNLLSPNGFWIIVFEILDVSLNITREELELLLDPAEQYYLDNIPDKYNTATKAGNPSGSFARTSEHNQNISESLKSRTFSETHLANLSKAITGRLITSEHSTNIFKALKGRTLSETHLANMKKTRANRPYVFQLEGLGELHRFQSKSATREFIQRACRDNIKWCPGTNVLHQQILDYADTGKLLLGTWTVTSIKED